ncbi:Protein ROOT PRIMORDIUM DEFECTIVE 1 [Linum perenne]
MMSGTGRIRLEHVRVARSEFGLPDDFEYSVVREHPEYFRLVDASETRNKYIEIVERDPKLSVCAIEKVREREYRTRGLDAEDYYRIAVWKWQRVPYWSPYEDISGYDLRSIEAQKRMEKRAVATIHELLSLTVEKKITLERIAHFRMAMSLPKKLKEFLLQHQGIFYISTRGNQGKLHTVFLREAYKRGELIEPNELYLARRKLGDLVLMSPRKVSFDRELVSYRRVGDEDDDRERVRRSRYVENEVGGDRGKGFDGEKEVDDLISDLDSDADGGYTDSNEPDMDETCNAGNDACGETK